jgi:membrane-associated phospholipid phosphatase
MHVSLIGCLIGAILLAGIVMTSRLYLKSHSPAEVWSGFFLGLLVAGGVLMTF